MKILSVDDNAQNLYLIEAVARALDYEVVSAVNGTDALERLEEFLPDLVISDILMPEMDGFQLCHELKSRERTRRIPFIFYTATYTSKQDEELALSLGASRFIVKPMDPEQFMAVIAEVAGESNRGDIPVPAVQPTETIDYLKAYNSRLVCKLDRKIKQLEASQHALQESLAARDRAEQERSSIAAQFLHAQKLESVGRLAGGIAHDFNNLLTVINAHSELLLKQFPSNPMRDSVQEICTAGERAARLTRQLLAFSRREVVDARPLNLSRAVGEIQGMVQSLVGKNIEVVTHLSQVGQVMADEGQLHQVLLNLVVNARDAMSRGGRITIATQRVDAAAVPAEEGYDAQSGNYVLLSVSDTGTGMTRETLSHIFEPFFTTKGEEEGTGLGLSTVYGIVRQSGGWIRAESEPGLGSTFHIWLPEHKDAEAVTEAVVIPMRPTRGQETVLVVDDYASVRSIMVQILTFHGYQVMEAASGGDALAIAEQHAGAIDLLVTDVQMHRMDGPELAKQLRARQPNLRVLFASAHVSGAWSETMLGEPGVGWITKPFTSDTLAGQVRELLDGPGVNVQTAARGRS